jgi:hypothetical protein
VISLSVMEGKRDGYFAFVQVLVLVVSGGAPNVLYLTWSEEVEVCDRFTGSFRSRSSR